MPFVNLNDKHFTDTEKTAIESALQTLENLLKPKLATLTPEERSTYGSVAEQNKLVISKVRDYRMSQQELSSPDVDWEEFEADFQSRVFLQNLLMRMENIESGVNCSKILHDWDNYQATLTDYDYTKYKNSIGSFGYEVKSAEIRQFFGGRPPGSGPTPDKEE